MKANQLPEPEPGQGVMSTYIEGQTTPFLVHGDAEVIEGLYAAVKDKTYNVAVEAEKPAVRPVRAVEAPLPTYEFPTKREKVAQYFADAKLRKFDKLHDTNLYEQKLEQRRKTAVFLMASEAQLFDRGSDYYRSQLKRLAKAAIKG